ncbi:sensor histidine kinase [Bifidobacterium vespertilionis]|uniref:Histidine kinase n=1 Tax=Bifidobacterium vespertilionis TaxID=2562524 RepID=A0A5J5DSP9_9BIFI|nr:hypothetical protein [Bifidobacterium vespertilionis]KAA8816882.1 hypothetical protein EMO90_11015 [Bifidobacterium vespertilionis]KAA8821881.1 hypothetical protein EM848_09775 [Bifidobacterium vespertilionis]
MTAPAVSSVPSGPAVPGTSSAHAWIRTNWPRILICLTLAALCVHAVFFYPRGLRVDGAFRAVCAVAIALLVLEIPFPRTAGVAMTLLALLGGLLAMDGRGLPSPFAMADLMAAPLIWTSGLLAVLLPLWLSAICCAGLAFSLVMPRLDLFLFEGLMLTDGQHALLCVVAFLAGYALKMAMIARRRADAETENMRLRADSEQLAHLRQNVRLQRIIHDSVAGELTYIVLATRPGGLRSSADGVDDAVPMEAIHDHARQALIRTREAIALLADEGSGTIGADAPCSDPIRPNADDSLRPTASPIAHLRDLAAQWDADLHALGFRGETTVSMGDGFVAHAEPGWISDPGRTAAPDSVISGLIREIYANIAAHGKADGGWYAVSFHVEPGELRIRAENEAADDRGGSEHLFHSGTGLDRQRAQVERLGGSLDVFEHAGVFKLFVEVPLDCSARRDETRSEGAAHS